MDLLTSAAYIAIPALIVVNALIVRRMTIRVRGEERRKNER